MITISEPAQGGKVNLMLDLEDESMVPPMAREVFRQLASTFMPHENKSYLRSEECSLRDRLFSTGHLKLTVIKDVRFVPQRRAATH